MINKLSPMKMVPVFKDYLWGGDRLVKEYGKNTPLRPVAESWEISCHPDGASKITSGYFKGMTLREVLRKNPQYICSGYKGDFPILIKLIDAKQSLSLQVHPDDDYANAHEGQLGKNEMWYVMRAEPDAKLIIGFKTAVSPEEIARRIADNTILQVANYVNVSAGDCFEIPAGMLHAIGEGVLIAEVQQSSNVTYRVYDYDRRDAHGSPRELHINKAVDVIDSSLNTKNRRSNPTVALDGYTRKNLTSWEWFVVDELEIRTTIALNVSAESFHALLAIEGSLVLNHNGVSTSLPAGESAFLPAGMGDYQVEGEGKLLLVTLA